MYGSYTSSVLAIPLFIDGLEANEGDTQLNRSRDEKRIFILFIVHF